MSADRTTNPGGAASPDPGEQAAAGPGEQAAAAGSQEDRRWLHAAIEISRLCPPTETAYAVGAIIVARDGHELARGHSREGGPHDHAEEAALAKLAGDPADLGGATIYTSMEPCSTRRSRPRTCTELILGSGLRRVVFALVEPMLFADCVGRQTLLAAGLEVIQLGDLGPLVREVNSGVLGPPPPGDGGARP